MIRRRSSAAYRIAFVYSLAFAAGTALLGVVIYWAMHVALTRQLDAMVADEAQTMATEYRSDGPGELPDAIAQREASRSPTRLRYAVFSPDGTRRLGSLDTTRPLLGIHDVAFRDAQDGPDVARGIAIDLSPTQRLVVAADREWVERADLTVIQVFAAAFVAVCLIGLLAAWRFGAYLGQRLNSISRGAEAIIGGDIRRRMPVGPDGDEFDELALTLNRMLDRIEGLLESLRQVSSDVAHDLRTPLTRLRNGLERGLGNDGGQASAKAVIEQSIDRVDEVLRLFAALLRIAEVESGETRRYFAEFDASLVATELVESYEPAVREGGRTLSWSIAPGLILFGDRELFAQAATNLVENAMRHTPPGTVIRCTLARAGSGIDLSVSDDGPGVAPSERGKIIERFKRLENSRHAMGHGLGLNLVTAVATLHGGRLKFGDHHPGLTATIEFRPKHIRDHQERVND